MAEKNRTAQYAYQYDGATQYSLVAPKAGSMDRNGSEMLYNYTTGVIFTFDDGYASIYSIAAPIMATYGIEGTAYIISSLIGGGGKMTLANIQALYAAGWDIANHTYDHADLTTLTEAQQESELSQCTSYLTTNSMSRSAYHVAYPGGTHNANTLTAMANTGMLTGRVTDSGQLDPLLSNMYLLSAWGTGGEGSYVSLQQTKDYITNAIATGRIASIYFHDINSGNGNLSTADFTALCVWIQAQGYNTYTISQLYINIGVAGFETNVGNWTGAGNHSIARSISQAHIGQGSALITASGAGNSSTNYVQLDYPTFVTSIVLGYKYTLTLWARSITNGTTITGVIGDKSLSSSALSNSAWTKVVLNFQATASTINKPLRLYLNAADGVYIDDLSLRQSKDCMIVVFVREKQGYDASNRLMFDMNNGAISANGRVDLYRTTSNTVTGAFSDAVTGATCNNTKSISDGLWHSVIFLGQADGNQTIYVDGVAGTPVSIIGVGNIAQMSGLALGYKVPSSSSLTYWRDLISETQVVLFSALPSNITSIISQISNQKKCLASYPNGTITFWNDPKNGIIDKSGNGNNLTNVGNAPIVRK